jgi:hypothetical protein
MTARTRTAPREGRVVVVAAAAQRTNLPTMASDQSSDARLLGVSALLVAASTTLTIVWCASMSAMGMPMPGGWTMSMVWMRMPGQAWLGTATSFLGM